MSTPPHIEQVHDSLENAYNGEHHNESAPVHLTQDSVQLLAQRQSDFDGDDTVAELIQDLVEEGFQLAETAAVAAKLPHYVARTFTDQLFNVIAACAPSCARGATQPPVVSVLQSKEDPPRCLIDVTCRHEIGKKEPPAQLTASTTPPATPRGKTKRLLAHLTKASALFGSQALSPPASSVKGGSKKLVDAAPTVVSTPRTPVPGVPYSTAPAVSPRKAIATLRTGFTGQFDLDGASDSDTDRADVEGSIDVQSSPSDALQPSPLSRENSSTAKTAPREGAADSVSSSWSLILPSDSSRIPEDTTPSSIAVEFVLPGCNQGKGLPDIHRRRSSVTAHAHTPQNHRRSVVNTPAPRFFPEATASEAVGIDPLGLLGYELRSRLSLSAGVRMQSEDGGVVQSGPDLPLFPTKMRRSTFMDASLALAVTALSANVSSPTRPPERPATTPNLHHTAAAPVSASGLFSLTEWASSSPKTMSCSRAPSTQSRSPSHASSSGSSTTSSIMFRKPSRVPRPCTASANCSSDHHGCCGSSFNTGATNHESVNDVRHAELGKERAYQRKLSSSTLSPKKSQSRRSLATQQSNNPINQPPASPLSRRSLTAAKNASLRNATNPFGHDS